jgi:phospholipid-binding lipoprotein MlaA
MRDALGGAAGLALDPLVYARYPGAEAVGVTSVVAGGLQMRANADRDLKALYVSATDPYASIRSYYLQNREAQINGGKIQLQELPSFGDTPAPHPPPQSTPGESTPGESTSGESTSGESTSGQSTSGQSTPARELEPQPAPVIPIAPAASPQP